jgi:hypothetical protein
VRSVRRGVVESMNEDTVQAMLCRTDSGIRTKHDQIVYDFRHASRVTLHLFKHDPIIYVFVIQV